MPAEPLLPTAPPVARLLLTPREAAAALAVCSKTLWTFTRRGDLPAVRIGRAVRYDVADLRAFVDRRRGAAHE